MKVAILGAGSWGTALACKAIQAGQDTTLWCRRQEAAEAMVAEGENKAYLPGVKLPADLRITADMEQALSHADIILLVTPSIYLRSTVEQAKPFVKEGAYVLVCSKGLERETGKQLGTVVEEVLGSLTHRIAILSGPNHAEEVGRNYPTTTVVAGDKAVTAVLQQALNGPTFRVYVNEDMLGVELAGTTKNIVALAAGIADGMGLGDNCKAALLTRGLHEMARFGVALGAKRETFSGLAGMGDLIATCMSRHSRNRAAGQKLAEGYTMNRILEETNMVVEGFYAAQIVAAVGKEKDLDLPITYALYDVLYRDVQPQVALEKLLGRTVRDETFI